MPGGVAREVCGKRVSSTGLCARRKRFWKPWTICTRIRSAKVWPRLRQTGGGRVQLPMPGLIAQSRWIFSSCLLNLSNRSGSGDEATCPAAGGALRRRSFGKADEECSPASGPKTHSSPLPALSIVEGPVLSLSKDSHERPAHSQPKGVSAASWNGRAGRCVARTRSVPAEPGVGVPEPGLAPFGRAGKNSVHQTASWPLRGIPRFGVYGPGYGVCGQAKG